MITTANIYKSIKTRLSSTFPTITNQIKDIKNITEPCLYVQFVNSSDKEVANDTYNVNTTFNVVYFSDKKTLLDLTKIETSLRQTFKKPLVIYYTENNEQKNRFLQPEFDSDFDEEEYTLTFTLNFEYYDSTNVDNPYDEYVNNENMENLQSKIKNN